jgi:hypothetical protein
MHLPIAQDENLMLLAFVRMGGESLPWAVGFCRPDRDPTVLTVPEARTRDDVAAMLAEFAPHLMRHLGHPDLEPLVGEPRPDDLPFRQVWLPNPSHIAMLHLLSFRYTFARRGDETRVPLLNALGRLGGWAFREAQRAGQTTVIDATAALREAFEFPSDDLRQQHLGLLIALLETEGDRDARETAAEEAEELSISINLDPMVERDTLQPLVERYGDARREGTRDTRSADAIAAALTAEVEHRLDLLKRAIGILRADARPPNEGANDLVAESARERLGDYINVELRLSGAGDGQRPWIPDPETDRHPSAAAAQYLKYVAASDSLQHALIHHDIELQHEAVAAGDGIVGTIVDVRDATPDARAVTPVWTIEGPGRGPLRLRVGSGVCVAGVPKRSGYITRLDLDPHSGRRTVEVEIKDWKTKPKDASFAHVPHAADRDALVGEHITLLTSQLAYFAVAKRQKVWKRDGPGAWLTHNMGSAPDRSTRRLREDPLTVVAGLRGD